MSLLVNLIPKSPDKSIEDIEALLTRQDLFGFEEWRKTLWGHNYLKNLGCIILPKLENEASLFIYNEDIEKLKIDFEIVLQNLSSIEKITNINSEIISERVLNALEVIRIANLHIKEVGIALW